MQSKRGFVQILPLVLLGVFAVTTIIITNNARQQSNVTRERSSAACSADKPVYCGGCIAGCYSYAEIAQYGGGCQAMIDKRCNQQPTTPPQPTQAPANPPAGGQPTAPCGTWNVSCNNGEGFSTTDCVVIRDYFGGDENKWKTEACQNRCGVIETTNTCGGGTGGTGGGPSANEKAITCETGGPTASACYGQTVGAGCKGFDGVCINNGGLNSDGYAVCGCRADAAPTQRPLATATSRPIEPYCDPTVFADCRADGLRCIPDRNGGYCETAAATRTPTRIPSSTSQPTARPSSTRAPSPTQYVNDDYFTRLPTATRVPSATPTIRFVERENVYNSPTPGIGSGYRCGGDIYRGRCTGQGLICDRTPFGQIDCASGQTCVPIAAICRTPAVPTNTPRPTTYTILPSPTTSSRGTTTGYAAYCSVSGTHTGYPACSTCPRTFITISNDLGRCSDPVQPTITFRPQSSRTPFSTAPPGYWITTPDVSRPSSTAAPRPTVDLSAATYCSVGTSSFYRPCSECAGGAANVEYPFGQTSSLRRCRNGYDSGSTYQISSPTPISRPTSRSVSLQDGIPCGPFTINSCDDCQASTFRPRSGGGFECGRSSSTQTVQSSTPYLLRPGSPCSAPGYNVPGLPSCYDSCPGQRYTYQDQANSPAGTRVCVAYTPSGTPLPTIEQRKTTAAQDGRGGCCERRPYFENEGCFGSQTCSATDDRCESGLSCTTVPTNTPVSTSSAVSGGFRWCDPSDGKRICTPGRACTDCSLLGYNQTSSCKAFAWIVNAHCENGSEPTSTQPTYQVLLPTPTVFCQPTPTPNPQALLAIGTACYISGTSIDDCEKCPYSGVAITPLEAQNTRVCSLPRPVCR